MDCTCVYEQTDEPISTTHKIQSSVSDNIYTLFVTVIDQIQYLFSFNDDVIKRISSAFDNTYTRYEVNFLSDKQSTRDSVQYIYAINYEKFQHLDSDIQKILVVNSVIFVLTGDQVYVKKRNFQEFIKVVLPPEITACDLIQKAYLYGVYRGLHVVIKASDNNLYNVELNQLNPNSPLVATVLKFDLGMTLSYNIFSIRDIGIVTCTGTANRVYIDDGRFKLSDFNVINKLYGRNLDGKILESYFQLTDRVRYWCGSDTILTSKIEIRIFVQPADNFGIAIGYDNEIYLKKNDEQELIPVVKPGILSDAIITGIAFVKHKHIAFFTDGWCYICIIRHTTLELVFYFQSFILSKFQNDKRMTNTKRALH